MVDQMLASFCKIVHLQIYEKFYQQQRDIRFCFIMHKFNAQSNLSLQLQINRNITNSLQSFILRWKTINKNFIYIVPLTEEILVSQRRNDVSCIDMLNVYNLQEHHI